MEAWDQSLQGSEEPLRRHPLKLMELRFIPIAPLYRLELAKPLRDQLQADLPFSVPSLLGPGGTGILTCFPSPTPFGLGLGSTNPARITLAQETLGFRRTGFSPVLSLLMSA